MIPDERKHLRELLAKSTQLRPWDLASLPFTARREEAALIVAAVNALPELLDALTKIDAIRNSIIGRQCANWSMHIYPLVAALDEAGFGGDGYDVARPKAEAEVSAMNAEIDAAVARAERAEKLANVACSFVSALTGTGVDDLKDAVIAYRASRPDDAEKKPIGDDSPLRRHCVPGDAKPEGGKKP
jgi:hypothetical protein